jgi:protein-tyrosine sulfotransferase
MNLFVSNHLRNWNSATEVMLTQCRLAGPNRCLIVYYEQLVMDPRFWLQHLTSFLDLPWQESLLHHETFIGQAGKISLTP